MAVPTMRWAGVVAELHTTVTGQTLTLNDIIKLYHLSSYCKDRKDALYMPMAATDKEHKGLCCINEQFYKPILKRYVI